ncbi:hypothetical protein [Nocardioides sp. GXQ0305]|uniref:hypothetical protein n=1 Tax=Nocardioides sp. GXQ0305 TaxID=3423912 RepID=UPI003D7C5EA0
MRGERPVVTLHVGTPKSGTTSLQNILARNRTLLQEHGYLYPGERSGHFLEALDLRDSGFRGHRFEGAEGAWDRLVEAVLAHDGPALLSHEVLGGSTRKPIKRGVQSFPGREVHVVVTCRDLARQLPAVWQEGVKNGDTVTYTDFLRTTLGEWKGVGTGTGMWRGQDLSGLGDRWAAHLDPSRVHFVTVPPSGSGSDVLWQRFREATGLPEADYAVPDAPRNPSMGTVETELLRRIVERLPDDVPRPTFTRQVKRRLAQRRLVNHRAGGSLGVPEPFRPAVEEISAEIVEGLRAGGFTVHGDLADLTPAFRDDSTAPDEVSDGQLLDRALEVLAPLVLRDQPDKRG